MNATITPHRAVVAKSGISRAKRRDPLRLKPVNFFLQECGRQHLASEVFLAIFAHRAIEIVLKSSTSIGSMLNPTLYVPDHRLADIDLAVHSIRDFVNDTQGKLQNAVFPAW